jgi:hypothetical protein
MAAETRVAARVRRLAGLPEPLPEAAGDTQAIIGLSETHAAVIDAWFANGCRSKRAACRTAGMHGNSAPDVFARPAVLAEIKRRRERIAEKLEITEDWIKQELGHIATARLGDLLEIQEDGSAWIDLSSMTDGQKAALAEYHVETYQVPGAEDEEGYTVKKSRIKLHDKKGALDSLARIMGMNNDKLAVTVGLTLAEKVQQSRLRLRQETTIEGELAK